ncbi:MAG: hypothetical protein HGA37_00565 [Lentimicrobium sp.]|nr:hypothetical protein [Lentimicrobium sp.]
MRLLKNILFGLLMLMIGLPLVQRTVPVFKETPLKGAYELPAEPDASVKTWFDGSFQEKYNGFAEYSIGLRPLLVRINNQIAFSVFDTALANGVIVGKNHYLYEINYIKAWKGWDFVGQKTIDDQVNKTAFVNAKLREAGKTLIILFAPGKASYFPEFIPVKYTRRASGETTNYQAYLKSFSKTGVPLIDFNDWFVKMKDTVSYELYPQCGIHWSAYGVTLALDSLINFIEKDRNIDMVDFSWNGVDIPDTLRNPDYDIAEGMNLLFKIPHYPMAYPRISFGNENGKTKPDVIVVSDSYYWSIFGKGYANRIFADNNFWYYNKEAHNPEWPAPRKTEELNIIDAVGKADVIMIMATEANLYRFPYGFIDRLYEALMAKGEVKASSTAATGDAGKEAGIAEIMKSIDSSPGWKESVQKKAAKKGISYEEMLRLDATWTWEQKQKK